MHTAPTALPTEAGFTPSWVQNAVFYQIFPDRFARSAALAKPPHLEPWTTPPTRHGFKGGDLLGVTEQLDYLQDLGVTALYLNPIFRSTANHRYHTHDYFVVDPLLGGNDALRTLLDEAHRRGVRVVLDGVFNHASRGFFQFNHILENGFDSPYFDWFHIRSWPLHPYPYPGESPGYDCWWGMPDLPKFNTDTAQVREFLWRVGEYWIEQGVDGWRLDVPNEIDDDEFWREFRRRVKGANPEAYIVGEIWGDAQRWLNDDQFDGVMNYIFTRACLGFFAGFIGDLDWSQITGSGLDPVPRLDAPGFAATINRLVTQYPWSATLAQLNLLDSHDTARFLTIARGDQASLRLATLFQMTFPGVPCVYYGDEIGLQGGKDPDSRRTFPWDAESWNEGLRAYVKRCIALRHAHQVLRTGGYRTLFADGGVYVFARMLGPDIAIIALNAGNEDRTVSFGLQTIGGATEVHGAWDAEAPELQDDAIHDWQLSARSGRVLLGTRGVFE